MAPADVARLVDLGDVRVSPDGATVAFTVQRVDLDADAYRTSIWTVAADGSAHPAQLTPGEERDLKPRFSPDGSAIAFVTIHGDGTRTVRVLELATGQTTDVLSWPDEVDELAWSPDGRRLALSARVRDEATYSPTKDRHRPARRVDRLSYRLDSVGWTIDRRRQVLVVERESGSAGEGAWSAPRQITDGPFQTTGIAWSPDSRRIAFASGRHDTWDRDMAVDVYVADVEAGASAEPVRLTETGPTHLCLAWSPDGRWIAFCRGDRRSFPRNGRIGVVAADGSGEVRILTGSLDRNAQPYLLPARDLVWDGGDVVFQVEDRGGLHLWRVGADGGAEPQQIVGGERLVSSYDVAGGTVAYVAGDPTHQGDVFVTGLDGSGERRLTTLGDELASHVSIAAPEPFTARAEGGPDVDAWLIRPPGAREGDRLPVVVNVHGGPFSQYTHRVFDEFQVLAGAGYAVVYSNPRGSSGREEAFARAIRGPKAAEDPGTGWGGADYDDVLAVVDEALRRFPELDPDRVAIMGGSYGGFMASWAIGHTDRFKTAVSERAVNDVLAMTWHSDIGHHFNTGYIGVSPLDDPEEFERQSPVTYVRSMDTPVLILHSEDDLRCPVGQAEALFVRLRLLGKACELVRFPGESHELTRKGAPRHRVERFEIILDWLERTL